MKKKILMALIAVFGLLSIASCATIPTTAKSENIEVVVSQSALKAFSITDRWGQPVELQVGYITNSWRSVVEKTGISRGWWVEKNSDYTDITTPHFLLIKGRTSKGTLTWNCFNFHGDGTFTFYTADL